MSKIQEIIKQYGKMALYTHIGYSLAFFGAIYFIISKKYIDPHKLMKKVGIDTSSSKAMQVTGDAAISYIIYKALMPARLFLTALTVPILAKILKRK
jgi:hypothetical protein